MTSYCGSDLPSFVLSIVAGYFGDLPNFKLLPSVADSDSSNGVGGAVKETLCGYVTPDLEGCPVDHFYRGHMTRARVYRLIYRRRSKNDGIDGRTLPPPASARAHDYDADTMGQREERRLMATEEGRQRYGFSSLHTHAVPRRLNRARSASVPRINFLEN